MPCVHPFLVEHGNPFVIETDQEDFEQGHFSGAAILAGFIAINAVNTTELPEKHWKLFTLHVLGLPQLQLARIFHMGYYAMENTLDEVRLSLGAATLPQAVHNAFQGQDALYKTAVPGHLPKPFSPQQHKFIEFLAKGMNNRDIADETDLDISRVAAVTRQARHRTHIPHGEGLVLALHLTNYVDSGSEPYPGQPAHTSSPVDI